MATCKYPTKNHINTSCKTDLRKHFLIPYFLVVCWNKLLSCWPSVPNPHCFFPICLNDAGIGTLQTTFLLCQLTSYKALPRGSTKDGL